MTKSYQHLPEYEIKPDSEYAFKEGHWLSDFRLNPEEKYGFIYEVRFLLDNKRYIGKKAYHAYNKSGTKKLKDSNWKTYSGSSKELQTMVDEYGEEAFQFIVLREVCTKSCWSYSESNALHKVDALSARDALSEERIYLNKAINKVQWIPKHCNNVIYFSNYAKERETSPARCS